MLILPSVNHANFSNGRINATRGDLETTQSLRESATAIAAAVVAFITANFGDGVAAVQAVQALVAQQQATMDVMAPLAVACGFGDIKAAHTAACMPPAPPAASLPGGVVPGSMGVEDTIGDAAYVAVLPSMLSFGSVLVCHTGNLRCAQSSWLWRSGMQRPCSAACSARCQKDSSGVCA